MFKEWTGERMNSVKVLKYDITYRYKIVTRIICLNG